MHIFKSYFSPYNICYPEFLVCVLHSTNVAGSSYCIKNIFCNLHYVCTYLSICVICARRQCVFVILSNILTYLPIYYVVLLKYCKIKIFCFKGKAYRHCSLCMFHAHSPKWKTIY